jgi:hypothetical protein
MNFRFAFKKFVHPQNVGIKMFCNKANKNEPDAFCKFSTLYLIGIGTGGVIGGGIGMHDSYQLTKNENLSRNIIETSFGAIIGCIFGIYCGCVLPIILPIGVGVTISRNFR